MKGDDRFKSGFFSTDRENLDKTWRINNHSRNSHTKNNFTNSTFNLNPNVSRMTSSNVASKSGLRSVKFESYNSSSSPTKTRYSTDYSTTQRDAFESMDESSNLIMSNTKPKQSYDSYDERLNDLTDDTYTNFNNSLNVSSALKWSHNAKPSAPIVKPMAPPDEPLQRDNTNFSVKFNYDQTSRSLMNTPHVYQDLEGVKTPRPDLRTPDPYQKLEQPRAVNIYAELKVVNPRPAPKTVRRRKKITKQTSNESSSMSMSGVVYEKANQDLLAESLINLNASGLFNESTNVAQETKETICEIKLYEFNTDPPVSNLSPTRASPGKKETIKSKSSTKHTNGAKSRPTNQANKLPKKLVMVKEFKHCILTDLKIGEGEFSETYQGYRYDLGKPVKIAAKCLKNLKNEQQHDAQAKKNNLENLLSEISVLTSLGKHKNVVEYLGVNNYNNVTYMIFEYAENGDLKRLLDQCRKNSRKEAILSNLYKLKLGYEIASGMEYISSLDIVHKDLAARNILLDKNYSCKISDFGCCKSDFLNRRPGN